jgi:uncharacterized membrane protein HdeD (DUF308 family)
MVSNSNLGNKVLSEFQKNRGWLIALGLVLVALGASGLYMEVSFPATSLLYFVALLMGGGLFHLFYVYKADKWIGRLSHLVTSLVYLAGGLVMILFPDESSNLVILMVGVALIVVGGFRVLLALQGRSQLKRWAWIIVFGVLSICLGCMLILQAPWPAKDVLAMFICIELILQGLSMTYVAIAAGSSQQG